MNATLKLDVDAFPADSNLVVMVSDNIRVKTYYYNYPAYSSDRNVDKTFRRESIAAARASFKKEFSK